METTTFDMTSATRTQLYDPAEHEPLLDITWDTKTARSGAFELVRDTIDAGANGLWPMHPDDAHDPDSDPTHATCAYLGAAGVLLAIDWLHRAIGTPRIADVANRVDEVRDAHRLHPELAADHPSYLLGTSGIETIAAHLTASPIDDALAQLRRAIDNPTHDPLTGAGNALDALLALRATRADDERIDALFRAGVARELDALEAGPAGCDMWLVDLYGNDRWMIGAGHGAAGTLHPMLRALDLLDETQRQRVLDVTRALLSTTAMRDGDLVNWAPQADTTEGRIAVQWCHGAPGVITSCARAAIDHDETRELLLAGGELVWHAGPLAKGPTICHGTAGNALAFLELFELTDDELWLDRARRFAMHALAQARARRDEVGQGRYSLFTGDLGVAVVLAQCEAGQPGILTLDML